MSILMFSGMRKPILSLVFKKKVYLCKYEQKQADIAVKLRLTLFWLIVFFPVLIMLGWFPYGDRWADVELLSLWMFFVKNEIQNGGHEITEVIFSIIFFIRNYNKTNPTIIRHHYIA